MSTPMLTDVEKDAKEFLMRLVTEAGNRPCEIGTIEHLDNAASLPVWYDPVTFKRGQQYFHDNRCGMFESNLFGLITLLCEPRGLKLLDATGRSSTTATAKRRYVSTIRHVQLWYEIDLTPGSKSWKSLQRVRQMHFHASQLGGAKGIGGISQMELGLTTFGFMGFALIRPHLLGIRHDNDNDRAAFVHFWAVLCHQLGICDTFNMCLLPLPVVEIVCHAVLRYVFVPLVQLETPEFRHMVQVMFDGMSQFLPFMEYDLQMFHVRRICGVPGYQYGVDIRREVLCRHLFTIAESRQIRDAFIKNAAGVEYAELLFSRDVVSIDVHRDCMRNQRNSIQSVDVSETAIGLQKNVSKILKLEDTTGIQIQIITLMDDSQTEWSKYLNNAKYYELSKRDQYIVRFRIFLTQLYSEWRLIRFVCEAALTLTLCWMETWQRSKQRTPLAAKRKG